ncbi:hypothetical protein CSKR_201229 [Clonorchis sinensis]|uniref:Uncharacterized protein n=1 Tax=Clonorchis sinensis TaxID=79923 RepID=A0A8T1MMI8_CLOSI|nr:hypothetical protein CSKR_201229 [Clonorchis sinensis]
MELITWLYQLLALAGEDGFVAGATSVFHVTFLMTQCSSDRFGPVRKLIVANSEIDFIQDCIRNCICPKIHWNTLRRSHIPPEGIPLKCHPLSHIDVLQTKTQERGDTKKTKTQITDCLKRPFYQVTVGKSGANKDGYSPNVRDPKE